MLEESSTTTGIILSRRPRREADGRLFVYTKDFGKLDLAARGLLKAGSKLAGHLEPLNLVELLIIKGRGHNYIASARNLRAFTNLKSDLNKVYFAGRALYLFNHLVSLGQTDQALFDLLNNYLEFFDSEKLVIDKEKGLVAFNFFVLKLLSDLGSAPSLYNCLIGAEKIKPGINYFSLAGGGLICGDCYKKLGAAERSDLILISDNLIKLCRLAPELDFYKINNLSIKRELLREYSRFLKSFLTYHYNFPQK